MLGWEAVVGLEKLPPPALMSLAAPRGDLFPDGVLMILGAGARLKEGAGWPWLISSSLSLLLKKIFLKIVSLPLH